MRGALLRSPQPLIRLRPIGGAVLQIGLLLLMLMILASALAEQVRGLSLVWLIPFILVGLGLGWILARSRLAGWAAGISLSLTYLVFVLFWVGQLASLLGNLYNSLLRNIGVALTDYKASDFSSLLPILESIWLGISIPFIRIYQWGVILLKGEPAYDPLVTAMLGSALVFALTAWAAWAVRRKAQPLIAILPAGTLLLVVLYLTKSPTVSLVAFLAIMLFLSALVSHRSNVQDWEARGTGYAEDIHFDLFWVVGVMVIVLSMAAYLASTLSVETIYDFSRRFIPKSSSQVENLAESLGIDLGPAEIDPFGELRNPGLPRNHLVQAGPDLSKEQVMTIGVAGLSPIPEADGTFSAPRLYWRGLTYDLYTGRGWRSSQTSSTSYPAGEANPGEPAPDGQQIIQEIRRVGDPETDEEMILYAAGMPVNLDQARQVAWRSSQDIFGVSGQARQYQAVSLLNEVPEDALRHAQGAYPDWVLERYLQLPDNLPERVRRLALQVTSAAPSSYDRALAIEKYLRTFPYSLDVPSPPPGREVSDYFLFDLQRGYCDYYATSMVVMSRAAGLPARLVIGYASGAYDPADNRYHVTAADAHSWVEVFFPGYGWIGFEPTGGLPAIDRASASDLPPTQPPDPSQFPGFNFSAWLNRLPLLRLTLISLLAAGLVILAWFLLDRMLLLKRPPQAAVVSLYHRLLKKGQRLPFRLQPSQTPYEISTGMGAQLDRLAESSPFLQVIHPGSDEIADLTEVYVRTAYSPEPPGAADRRQAVRTWGRLRWRLWLAKWLRRIQRTAV